LFCRNSINNNNTNSWAELEKNQLHRCIGQSVRTTEVYDLIIFTKRSLCALIGPKMYFAKFC